MKNLFIKTFGCQMNVYDSDKMATILKPLGYQQTDTIDAADLVLLNTCHIREKAAEKLYSDLGRIRGSNKNSIVAVTGCVAQAEGEEVIKRAPNVDIVMGPQSYHRLPEMVAKAERAGKANGKGAGLVDTDFPVENKFDALPANDTSSPAAFLSIQEGCDKFCTFCVVPYTRGSEFSRPIDAILTEAKDLVAKGASEINMLGQNVNAWHGGTSFADLLYKMADIEGLERIRFTTSHPRDLDDPQIQAFKDLPQLMPYFHLPVQSGSDRILEAMNRKHKRDLYFELIDKLRTARPDIAMSSDFIVGFPGETDKDFDDTMDLVRRVGYAQAYSFGYSIRPGTPAGILDKQVPEDVKKQRLYALQNLLNTQQIAFNQSKIGTSMPVLIERVAKDGALTGRSPYMQSVYVQGNPRLVGEIVNVTLTHAGHNSVKGTIDIKDSAAA